MELYVMVDAMTFTFAKFCSSANAGVMAVVQTAILAKLPYQTLRDAIPHAPDHGGGIGTSV